MTHIQFEQWGDVGLTTQAVDWPNVPRIGDTVDFDGGENNGRISGVVRDVVWWADGSVRVVLNSRYDRAADARRGT